MLLHYFSAHYFHNINTIPYFEVIHQTLINAGFHLSQKYYKKN